MKTGYFVKDPTTDVSGNITEDAQSGLGEFDVNTTYVPFIPLSSAIGLVEGGELLAGISGDRKVENIYKRLKRDLLNIKPTNIPLATSSHTTALDKLVSTGYYVIIDKSVHNNIHVSFERAYTKDDGLLIGTYGVGDTVEQAAEDYIQKITGKTMVFYGSNNREEVIVFK